MKNLLNKLISSILFFTLIFLSTKEVLAVTAVNLKTTQDPKEYNVYISGLYYLYTASASLVDLNNNGLADLIIYAQRSSGDRGLYITYDDKINKTGVGNTLVGTSEYTAHIYSANSANFGNFGMFSYQVADVTNDGLVDLIVTSPFTDYNTRANSGSVFIIPNSTFSSLTGSANNIDIDSANVWTTRIDGAAAGVNLTYASVGDYNNDSRNDLVVCSPYADNNSRTNSGSCYVLDNSKISQTSTYGTNTLDLNSADSYDVRFDGPSSTGNTIGLQQVEFSDLDNNGSDDLVIANNYGFITGKTNPGSVFVIKDNKITASNPTKSVDLATATNYNIRYNGANGDYLNVSSNRNQRLDLNNNGYPDLLLYGVTSGTFYISDSLIRTLLLSEGQDIDLSTQTNQYNAIITPVSSTTFLSNTFLGLGTNQVFFYNYDADYTGTDYATNVLLNSNLFSNITSTGQSVNSMSESNQLIRYDGGGAYTEMGGKYNGDVNGDGTIDYVLSDSAKNIWIVYNFPHSISVTSTVQNGSNVSVTGTVSAQSSQTTIANVEYKLDNNNPLTGWSSCSPSDGSFNSTLESFNCSFNSSSGNHTLLIRAKDSIGSYTPSTKYFGYAYTDVLNNSTVINNEAAQIPQLSNSLSGIQALSPIKDSSQVNQRVTLTIYPKTIDFNGYFSVQKITSGEIYDSFIKKGYRSVGSLQSIWLKTYPPNDSYQPAKIIPELQKRDSIIGISYLDYNLSENDQKRLKVAHSTDGTNWKIVNDSKVDMKNKTVAIIGKVGGYYSLIISELIESSNTKTITNTPVEKTPEPSNTTTDEIEDTVIVDQQEQEKGFNLFEFIKNLFSKI